jgi:hypothetical protein
MHPPETFAIIAFGDIDGTQGTIKAEEVFDGLFPNDTWYIGRYLRAITPGTKLLFYQTRVGVRGAALVKDVVDEKTSVLFGRPVFLTFDRRIVLADRREFNPPVNIRPVVENLDFITDKTYWGQSLRSTPRRISKSDYFMIITLANDSTQNRG